MGTEGAGVREVSLREVSSRGGEAGEGRYLYCVAEEGERRALGPIGIDGNQVYTIPAGRLCAVVHESPAAPYRSEDREVAEGWLRAHAGVVEAAWEVFGTVLPARFNTIVRGREGRGAAENVESWLRERQGALLDRIARLRGKAEYGVQIAWDAPGAAAQVIAQSPELRRLEEEMRSSSPGLAYLYRQKLERAIRAEMEARAEVRFRDFCDLIRARVADLRAEWRKPDGGGRQVLMSFSCLLRREEAAGLGEVLERIQEMEGFSVRFTGPWPPYSFVAPG